MRLISTLCLLLFSSVCFSQIYDLIRKADIDKEYFASKSTKLELCNMKGFFIKPFDLYEFQQKVHKIDTTQTKISLRCGSSSMGEQPLIVVDGLPVSNIDSIDINDIESIDVLKQSALNTIFSCRTVAGVILITTKSGKVRKFIIKDFLDGNIVSGATVSFISTDKKDTIMMAANDSGVVMTDKLKSSKLYEMSVSAIGYKTISKNLVNNMYQKEATVLLERDFKKCEEVIITNIGKGYHCRLLCSISGIRIQNDSIPDSPSNITGYKIFPNPVPKDQVINVEFKGSFQTKGFLKIYSLQGTMIAYKPLELIKGLNKIQLTADYRWAAGTYMVQVYANGEFLASEKIVIQ